MSIKSGLTPFDHAPPAPQPAKYVMATVVESVEISGTDLLLQENKLKISNEVLSVRNSSASRLLNLPNISSTFQSQFE